MVHEFDDQQSCVFVSPRCVLRFRELACLAKELRYCWDPIRSKQRKLQRLLRHQRKFQSRYVSDDFPGMLDSHLGQVLARLVRILRMLLIAALEAQCST